MMNVERMDFDIHNSLFLVRYSTVPCSIFFNLYSIITAYEKDILHFVSDVTRFCNCVRTREGGSANDGKNQR